MNTQFSSRKGIGAAAGTVVAALVVLVLMGAAAGGYWLYQDRVGTQETGSVVDNEVPTSIGGPIAELSALQVNFISQATEGGNDLEFWDKGADITDSQLSPRETLTFSSGAVTDTTVPTLRAGDTQATKDLYVDGGSTYYDDKVSSWKFSVNENAEAALDTLHPANAVEATDIGTIADIDTPENYSAGMTLHAAGTLNLSVAAGDGSYTVRLQLGNTEVDSVLRDFVICIGDADADLEGDEITGLTVSRFSGQSIGNFQSNMLQMFDDVAGKGGTSCVQVGDLVNDGATIKGSYDFEITFDVSQFAAGEEFEIHVDDLGGWNARDYPSRNVKATGEDLTIQRAP